MPYALCREELKDFTEAQATKMMIDSDAWQEVMVPILDELEDERKRKHGEEALYNSHLLESVLLYQRVCGLTTYRDARDRLASDKGAEARELLGLNTLRRYRNKPGKRVVRLMAGIPSESTISRHKNRFMEWRRAEAYEALFRRLVKEHLEWPEMREEARTLNLDGTSLLTHYTCPKYDSVTGQIVNDEYVTCFDGGYVGRDANPSKQGHGWNLVSMTTSTGLPLTYRLPVLHASEPNTGVENLVDYEANVLPFLDAPSERGITVLSADGGFNQKLLRMRARELGMLENIHVVSHSNKPESKANAAKNDAKRIPFDDPLNPNYKNWYANGHREVFCKHGRRATKRVSI